MPLGCDTGSLLTIAIPTFNRAELLRALLTKLSHLPPGDWQVLVSDNGSTDHTRRVIMDMSFSFPHTLTFIRNSTNLGFDANIEALVGANNSKYIWFLSDDDEIDPRNFETTLLVLEKDKPGLFIGHEIANTRLIQRYFKKLDLVPYCPSGENVKLNLGMNEFTYLDERKRVALVNQCGQISTSIIRTEGLEHSEQPLGTGIQHLTYVNQVLKHKPTVYVAPWPTVQIGAKEDFSRWFMDSTLYGVNDFFNHPATDVSSKLQNIVVSRALRFAIGLWGRGQLGLVSVTDRHSRQELFEAVSRSCTSQNNMTRLLHLIRAWDKAAEFNQVSSPALRAFDLIKRVFSLLRSGVTRLF